MSFHSNHSDSAIHGEDEAAPQRQAPLPPQEEETAADQVIDPSLPITPASSEYHDESLPRSEEDADKKGEEESLKSDSDKVDNDGANFYYTNADEPDDKPFTAEELPQKESFTNPVFGAPHHPVNVFPADADDSEAFRRDSTSAATGYHASVVQTIQPQAEGLHTGSEEPSDHDSSAMVPLRDGSMPNLDPLHTQDEESDHSSAAELPEQEEWNNPTQIDEQQAPSIASSIHSSNNISNSPASSRPFSTVSAGLMRSHPNDLVQQAHSPITPATVGPMGTPLIVKADPFKADPFDSKEPQAAEYNNHVSPFDNEEEENHPRG
ncbi:hypothetical protein ADEAN_000324700 [Angomonas deanei]|uniref:Uncharacterized protein n=1 Tax=Angomonas deanei TaxID=59799 RepID=A0A7G2C886_9TRYP|nr:hypothetical protein ADEAN_000324700 [Angomonas deanei]